MERIESRKFRVPKPILPLAAAGTLILAACVGSREQIAISTATPGPNPTPEVQLDPEKIKLSKQEKDLKVILEESINSDFVIGNRNYYPHRMGYFELSVGGLESSALGRVRRASNNQVIWGPILTYHSYEQPLNQSQYFIGSDRTNTLAKSLGSLNLRVIVDYIDENASNYSGFSIFAFKLDKIQLNQLDSHFPSTEPGSGVKSLEIPAKKLFHLPPTLAWEVEKNAVSGINTLTAKGKNLSLDDVQFSINSQGSAEYTVARYPNQIAESLGK